MKMDLPGVIHCDRLSVLLLLHDMLTVEVLALLASSALGVMMTMLLVLLICCHAFIFS